jgi:hypothetical protein
MDKFELYAGLLDEHFLVRLFIAISIATVIMGSLTLR